jgi:hypothetical protein
VLGLFCDDPTLNPSINRDRRERGGVPQLSQPPPQLSQPLPLLEPPLPLLASPLPLLAPPPLPLLAPPLPLLAPLPPLLMPPPLAAVGALFQPPLLPCSSSRCRLHSVALLHFPRRRDALTSSCALAPKRRLSDALRTP